jgi:DNA-binding CsgD family transcriptional regulator
METEYRVKIARNFLRDLDQFLKDQLDQDTHEIGKLVILSGFAEPILVFLNSMIFLCMDNRNLRKDMCRFLLHYIEYLKHCPIYNHLISLIMSLFCSGGADEEIINLKLKFCPVLYYRGDFQQMKNLLDYVYRDLKNIKKKILHSNFLCLKAKSDYLRGAYFRSQKDFQHAMKDTTTLFSYFEKHFPHSRDIKFLIDGKSDNTMEYDYLYSKFCYNISLHVVESQTSRFKELHNAINYLQESMASLSGVHEIDHLKIHLQLGRLFRLQGNYEQAEEKLLRLVNLLSQQGGDLRTLMLAHADLAKIKCQSNQLDKALNMAEQAKRIADQLGARTDENRIIDLFAMINSHQKKIILSPREQECAEYSLAGKSAKEIAKCMNISYRTVEKHFENMKLKTGKTKKTELLAHLIKQK